MKISRPKGVYKTEPVKRASSVARPGAGTAAPVGVPSDEVSIMGIPEAEFTPKVRDAVTSLLEEVDRLTRDLGEMKQRVSDLEAIADQDELLPVLNRRAFVRELSRLQSFGDRYDLKASLLYLDLNHFKTVNDTHGHAAGDKVLHDFVTTLRKNLRDSDVIGRLGGDEFGIVLLNADLESAKQKAGSLAQAIAKMKVPYEGKILRVTVAVGACVLTADVGIEDALATADRDMFDAKDAAKAGVKDTETGGRPDIRRGKRPS